MPYLSFALRFRYLLNLETKDPKPAEPDMADEEPKKVETETPSEPPPPVEYVHEAPKDVTEEKSVVPLPPPADDVKPVESKALAIVESK